MKKVLIVEDDVERQAWFWTELEGEVEITMASTIPEAIAAGIDFDMIVMDCCVPGDEPNTMDLVEGIRAAGFTNPILADSKDEDYPPILVRAGCNQGCHKDDVPYRVRTMLKLYGEVDDG